MQLPFTVATFINPDTGETYAENVQRVDDLDSVEGGYKFPWENPSVNGFSAYNETGAPKDGLNQNGLSIGESVYDLTNFKNWLFIGAVLLAGLLVYKVVRK